MAQLTQKFVVQVDKKDDEGNVIKDENGENVKEDQTVETQTIGQGPAASQIAIKQLGTNGGGFFNVNSAHPYENPTPFSNFLEMFSILWISAGLTYTLGRMVKSQSHGWAVYAAMLVVGIFTAYWAESHGNPLYPANVNQAVVGGSMASRGSACKLLRTGARIVGRHAYRDWYAVYVETSDEEPGRIRPETYAVLQENIRLAERLGAQVVKLKGNDVADQLLRFACENEITHVILGQSARTRWDIFWRGSVINRFLREVKDVAVHVIPIQKEEN